MATWPLGAHTGSRRTAEAAGSSPKDRSQGGALERGLLPAKRWLAAAVVAALLLGVIVPTVACNNVRRLSPFPSGETAYGLAGAFFNNPMEELIIYGYSIDQVHSDHVLLTARSWWCLPYARIHVDHDGATTRLTARPHE